MLLRCLNCMDFLACYFKDHQANIDSKCQCDINVQYNMTI